MPPMKTPLLFFILVYICFYSNVAFSQGTELEKLKKEREDLVIQRTKISDSINQLDVHISFLESKDVIYEPLNTSYTETAIRSRATLKNRPDIFGDIIGYIQEGDFVKVYDYFDGFWMIEIDSIRGFVSEIFLVNNRLMNEIKKSHEKDEIIKKYGESIANRIFAKSIWAGMTTEMARLSIGRPERINRSTGSWGVNEQWVYRSRYLYFENDKLTSWQD